jgi:hypothetical protein
VVVAAEPMPGTDPRERLRAGAFVLGGLSFIPLLGVPLGIAAIIWAAASKRRGRGLLALLGAGGIALTCVLYGGLFYFAFVQHDGLYDELRGRLAQTTLNSLVQSIEFYKVQNGRYPASLEQLKQSLPKDSLVMIYDPSSARIGRGARPFYYKLVDEGHYYLRGLGRDGVPFTADDILPQIKSNSGGAIGLLTEKPPETARDPKQQNPPR